MKSLKQALGVWAILLFLLCIGIFILAFIGGCAPVRVVVVKTDPPSTPEGGTQAIDAVKEIGTATVDVFGLVELARVDPAASHVVAGIEGVKVLGKLATLGVVSTGTTIVSVKGGKNVELKLNDNGSMEVKADADRAGDGPEK